MTPTTILIIIITIYILIDIIKSFTIGKSFSIIKSIRYGEDYIKWYKFKQTYVPLKDRSGFSKKKTEKSTIL